MKSKERDKDDDEEEEEEEEEEEDQGRRRIPMMMMMKDEVRMGWKGLISITAPSLCGAIHMLDDVTGDQGTAASGGRAAKDTNSNNM